MNTIFKTVLILAAVFTFNILIAQDEAETPEMPANMPAPPNFTPPPPPSGPPPGLPDFIKSRAPGRARPAASGQAAAEDARETMQEYEAEERAQAIEEQGNRPNRRRPVDALATAEEAAADAGAMAGDEPEEIVNELIFSDMSALEVIQILEELTGKASIRQQSIPAVKINFDSRGPMPKSEAIVAIESLLAINGIAVTELGENFLKIVPSGQAAQQVPTFLRQSTLGMQPSQAFFTKLFRLEYLDVEKEGQPLIMQFMSTNGQGFVVPFKKTNSLMVTDALVNLQRIEEVLLKADQPQVPSEEILFFQLENVKATDLQQRLKAIVENQNSALAKYFLNNTTIEADERTNQLIVLTHASNQRMIRELIEKLDIDVEPATTSRVFYIKHAKAVDIDALLEEVITGQQQVVEEAGGAGGNRQGNQPNQPQRQTMTAGQVDTSGMRFSEFITIVADERSNAIVAYGTKTDLDQIESLIDQIDILLAQVHVEVVIAEVTLSEKDLSGISALGLSYNPTQGPAGFNVTANGPENVFTLVGSASTDSIELTLNNAVSDQKAKILSAPVIVTTHNQEASVNVVQSRPFITGSVTSGEGAGGAVTNAVDYRDVGIQLKVTPLIGTNGVVQMEIEQIVENFTNSSVEINGVSQPFIDKREATSFVSVTDQETIVLAGLQQSEVGSTDTRLWLLGDIPIIGDLFTGNNDNNNRRELMLFIKPYVIYAQEDATRGADVALDNLDNGEDARFFMETSNMSAVFDREKEQQNEAKPKIYQTRNRPNRK